MRNTAYVFPGQGSQYAGMGVAVLERDPKAEHYFHEASEILGMDLMHLCCNGTEEKLQDTTVSQPAILTVSYLWYLNYRKLHDEIPLFYAGHSLGEYTALLAAGVLRFSEAIRLIGIRAMCMKRCAQQQDGTMLAVVCDAGYRKILPVVNRFRETSEDSVSISCLNSRQQIVLSGGKEPISVIEEKLRNMDGVGVFPLHVEGAFHSPLMAGASEEFEDALANTKFAPLPLNCGIISNVTGVPYRNTEELRQELLLQLTHPIHWCSSVNYMSNRGADIFIEFGSKPTLSKQIQKEVQKHAFSYNAKA